MSDVNGRLAASLSGCAALLRAVTCAPCIPAKKTPGRKAQRRFARRAPSLPGCLPWCSVRLSPFKPLRPGISRHKPPGCPVPLMLSGDIF
ncbi:MAG: hypothetical protein E7L40_13545, partial [Corynebacterium kroppenstedtii]